MMTDRAQPVNRKWWLLAVLTLIAFTLRVYQLDGQSLWSDEGLSLYRSRLTLSENLSNIIVVPPGVPTRDTNPPLYFILLSGARALLGEGEYALRFLSVVSGVLLVPLLYVMGRRLFSAQAGLLAAVLGTFSPFLVWYSQEARMYTLLAALSLASVYLLLRALDFLTPRLAAESEAARSAPQVVVRHDWKHDWLIWAAWIAVTLAMLASHFNAFFVLPFEGGILLLALMRARRQALITVLLLLALASPLMVYALSRAQTMLDPVFRFRPLDSIAQEVWSAFLVGAPHEIFQPWWAVLPGLALLVVGTIGGLIDKTRRAATLSAVAYLFVPLLALYGATYVLPVYIGPRHVIFILPPFYLLVAWGFALIWKRKRIVGLAALTVVVSLMLWWLVVQFTDPSYLKDDIRSATCTIAAQAKPDDVVVLNDAISSFLFDYYYTRCGGVAPWKIIPTYPSLDFDEALRQFQIEADAANRVWYLTQPRRTGGFDSQGLDEWARGHLLRLGHQTFPSLWLGAAYQLYTAHFPILQAMPPAAAARDLVWPSTGLHLVGIDPITVSASRAQMRTNLYWQLDRPASYNFDFTLRLVDDTGAEWGLLIGSAFDNWSPRQWPAGKIIEHSVDMSLPHGLPPGDYALRVKVSRRRTGEVLLAAGGSEEVEVARVKIE